MIKQNLEHEEQDLAGMAEFLRRRIVYSMDGFVNRLTLDLNSVSGGERFRAKIELNSDIYLD